MDPEMVLYYSENCFGTADAIAFNDNLLRMDDPMTATWFAGEPKPNEPRNKNTPRPKRRPPRGGTTTTAEVLYAQMFALGIPKECEKWHLNRLLTLIRVSQEMNAPQKKMTPGERMSQQRALNAQRRAKLHTRG